MAEKTNKTQEDIIDNTFGNFDDDIQTQTADPHLTGSDNGKEAAKKSNSNKLLYSLVGGAAVVVVGFMFLKPMLMGSGNSQPPVSPAPTIVNAPSTPAPTVAPVASTPEAHVVSPAPVASVPAADQNFLNANGQNPLAGNRSVPDTASATVVAPIPVEPVAVTPVVPAAPNVASQVASLPSVPVNASTVTPVAPVGQVGQTVAPVVTDVSNPTTNALNVNGVAGNNTTQQALVEQLKVMFEQQTRDIKGSIDAVGDRVTNVEKAISDQKDINKSIEERLAKLESGQSTKSIVSKHAQTDSVKSEHKRVNIAKAPTQSRKPVVAKRVEKDDNVLVDKSSVSTNVSATNTNVTNNAVAPSNIQIHSVFAGRVWIKNSDSSLATYVVGERLPTGEVIKQINDDKGTIVTDKRVIK